AAVVVLPKALLAPTPAVPVGSPVSITPSLSLPGADAEANSHVLPGRSVAVREPEGAGDPLIEAAERALLAREAVGTAADAAEATGNVVPEDDEPGADPASGAESVSETTMELFAPVAPGKGTGEESDASVAADDTDADDPDTIEPDTHERAADEGNTARTAEVSRAGTEGPRDEETPRLTDKGLPKRTPRITAPTPTAPRPRAGGVNAEELRRRLGGFHQGAKEGRRDVEAEIAEQSGETRIPVAHEYRTEAVDTTGGTSEEESS
ncbi:histidine kinase, partial [Streptomyces stelliscabiei]